VVNFDIVDGMLFEAHSALLKMQAQERQVVDPNRLFDQHHRAFLAACSTARDQFRGSDANAHERAIKVWRVGWENGLKTTGDWVLYDFMRTDRNQALHEGQSKRKTKTEQVPVSPYQDGSSPVTGTGGMINDGPQRASLPVNKRHYFYEIAGVEQDVTKVCAAYLASLQKMATDARAANL
jgi:hypothetical protein